MKKLDNLDISKQFVDDAMKILRWNKKLLRNIIEVCVDVYNNKLYSRYYRHSLKWNLAWICDFQVTWDIRLFVFIEGDTIKLLRIGTHSYLWI